MFFWNGGQIARAAIGGRDPSTAAWAAVPLPYDRRERS